MEIRVLKYFLTVAREGNITRASELLHITQPTLSRQLMQLEEQLGASLFIRGKRKMILTEDGMILKRRAEEIISLAQKTEMEIGNQNHEISGEISIGCGITEATQIMGILIRKFQELHPKVSFHISNGNGDVITEKIDNGLIDIGFVLEPVELEKLNFLHLDVKERYGLLVKKESLLAQKSYIIPADLKDISLINSSRVGTQNAFSNWYGKGYDALHFCATSELTTTAAILVKNDIGSAVVIEGSVKEAAGNDLRFIPFSPDLLSHSLLVWKKYKSFSLTVTKFIDFASKELKNLNY